MSDRPSRKRKAPEDSGQYQTDLEKTAARSEHLKKMRVLRKEIDHDLSNLFGKMQSTDEPQKPAVVDVEMGRGRRRRKTRKGGKKSRKTRRRH